MSTEFATCSTCGSVVPVAVFCSKCGAAQPTSQPKVESSFLATSIENSTLASGPPPTSMPRPGARRTMIIVAATTVLVIVAAGIMFATKAEHHTISGSLSLSISNTDGEATGSGPCTGTGGYDDIQVGRQVIVEDESGKTLATDDLSLGRTEGFLCVFTFLFDDVPKAEFYRVHQSGNRGTLQWSYQDMVDSNWSVALTLGD